MTEEVNMARSKERTEFLGDIIVTAVEGGTGYWAQVSQYQYVDTIGRHSWVDGELVNTPPEDPVSVVVGRREGDETRARLHEMNDAEDGYREEGLDLDLDAVARGIGRITRGEVGINSRLRNEITMASRENDAGYIDADGADVIVQAGLLGEIRYG
jgi:hypothetical protein